LGGREGKHGDGKDGEESEKEVALTSGLLARGDQLVDEPEMT
jgi:hypothetical protein